MVHLKPFFYSKCIRLKKRFYGGITENPFTRSEEVKIVYLLQVASLLDAMECCGISLHVNIHAALKNHHMAVCVAQVRCKEDSANVTKTHPLGIHFTDDGGINSSTCSTFVALRCSWS